jgi:uncharacterized protein YjiS (DUF1127 family)
MNRPALPAPGDKVMRLGRPLQSLACSRFIAGTLQMYRGFRKSRLNARAVKELSALDDRMLRDIGLTRTNIEAAAYSGRPLGARR